MGNTKSGNLVFPINPSLPRWAQRPPAAHLDIPFPEQCPQTQADTRNIPLCGALWASVVCGVEDGGGLALRSGVRGTPNGGAASWWVATANQRPPASPPRPASPCRWWKILLSGEWPKHWWALIHLFFYSEKNSRISFEKFTIISKACAVIGVMYVKGAEKGGWI